MDKKFLPRWFTVWFYISTAVLFAAGLVNELAGGQAEGFNPLGAAVGVFAMYLLTLFVWRYRAIFSAFVTKIPLPIILQSVLVGWFFSQVDELINFPFNPLFPSATLWQDLVFSSLAYIPGHVGWFWVLRRYAFTPAQALMTGGLSLGLFEMFSNGAAGLPALFILPFVIMVHGPHMVMPKLGLGSALTYEGQKETRWKYLLGIIFPALGVGFGIGVAFIVSAINII